MEREKEEGREGMSREGRKMWKGHERKEGEERRREDPLDLPPLENFLATPLHMHEMAYCRW